MKNDYYEEEMPDFKKIVNQLPKDSKIFVDKSMAISNRIADSLKEKNILQKDLALMLNKSEAEISKFLSGSHNYTLRTLSKIESVLGCNLINVPRVKETSCKIEYKTSSRRYDPVKAKPVGVHFDPAGVLPIEVEKKPDSGQFINMAA